MPARAVTTTAEPTPDAPDRTTRSAEPGADGGDRTPPTGDSAGASVDGLDGAGRRRLRRGWWAGAVPALGAYLWMLTVGRLDLLQRQYFDDFFDA
ncbi:MAG: hypothetical protein JXA83_13540, partial [Acidimicrobiales bacterium]|nr:hypothetical protein [Acidimicrobiales bacterium]